MSIVKYSRLLMLNTVHCMLVVLVLGGSIVLASDKQQQDIYPKDLSEWLQLEFPKCDKPDMEIIYHDTDSTTYETQGVPLYSALLSLYSWEVYSEDGNVYVRPYNKYSSLGQLEIPECVAFWYPEMPVFKVNDGWIVGTIEAPGAITGHILWYSNDCNDKYLISGDRVIQFIRYNNDLYALTGFSGYSIYDGKIIVIHKVDGRWEADRHIRLTQPPLAATFTGKDKMLVVTTRELINIHNDVREIIFMNDCWEGLRPNSVALDSDNNIYIGMEQGVAKIISGSGGTEIVWLVPNNKILEDDVEHLKNIYRNKYDGTDQNNMDCPNDPLDGTTTTERNKRIPLY